MAQGSDAVLRVLIADDDPLVRDIVRKALVGSGYEVSEAADGIAALELAESSTPDVVVLDWMMPGMQGPDVCQTMRSRPGTDRAAILLLTSRSHEEEVTVAFEKGADDYLTKPFDVRELTAVVGDLAAIVEKRRASAIREADVPQQETPDERRARGDALFARLRAELAAMETPPADDDGAAPR